MKFIKAIKFLTNFRKSYFSLLLVAFFCIFLIVKFAKYKNQGYFRYDVIGYYLYLPSTIIYHDNFNYHFYDSLSLIYPFTDGKCNKYGLVYQNKTKRYSNIYPIGVAIMQLPFFLLADTYSILFDPVHRDGFYHPYQLALVISSIFYCLLGFWFLRKFLQKYFSDNIIAICFILLFFGTNLLYYTIIEVGMSHVYSFCLVAMFIYYCQLYFSMPIFRSAAILGFIFGLICITRYTNSFVIIFPLLWQSKQIFTKHYYKLHLRYTGIALISFLIIISTQLFYWYYTTGHLLHNSYEGYSFDFSNPKIWKGLFSYRKGLFVYTPIALFGFIGIILLWRDSKLKFFIFPYLVFFIISFFVTFSWFMWYYGGSYGCRVYIEMYTIMGIPICALIAYFLKKKLIVKNLFTILCLAFIALNLFQSWQYSQCILNYGYMDKTFYWRIFGKTSIDEVDRSYLNTNQTFDD
jgi:hypothetical protein